MGNRKLYIIGNGFDLWHGIPSRYADFKAYVRQHDRQLLRTVDDYLPAGDDWSDLESALADLDIDSIIDDLSQFMPLLHPMMTGAAGTHHQTDWCIADHEAGYLAPAKTLAMMAIDLLVDNAAKANKTLAEFKPAMSKDAYLDRQHAVFKTEHYPASNETAL